MQYSPNIGSVATRNPLGNVVNFEENNSTDCGSIYAGFSKPCIGCDNGG